ncbi:MAG TPA: molybdopterin-dependent oxidoreductase [Ornithinimicrobium sp.]|uniref:molybdopterin-dependent oxidoreductase n=1 Tax=Ornithinimicrobium sp. TaxID=1977084 RepID=UPI002B47B756|nr:molybdopterin-dependent oxidoreductase [Ornithinimicrobium sp.]HKJ10863.1 molybdopterin-dependent oxidoreductase [Ornithinimicrobium sp.]
MQPAGHWYGKPERGFRRLGTSLEPLVADLGRRRTPLDRFFVCSAGEVPPVDPASWRLRVDGDAAATPVEVSLNDLRALEQVSVDAWLECAGNGRGLFAAVGGLTISAAPKNTPWFLGGLGLATWTGPRLSSVLELASPTDGAGYVGPVGLDHDNSEGETVRMSLPWEKALHPDTIVALTMNGADLLPAHGAPARLLVPGWVGAYSVKWLERLELATTWVDSFRANEYYVLRDEAGRVTGPATAHPVKSQLCLGWPAAVDSGPLEVHGYARSGQAPIAAVDWALDDGPWQSAELLDDLGPWAWRPFKLHVGLPAGPHTIRTRARDEAGNLQPLRQAPHRDGVLWNAVIPHPVTAT